MFLSQLQVQDDDSSISAFFQLIVIAANADPEFTQQQYNFSIPEDAPVDLTIGNVLANDDDSKSLMKLNLRTMSALVSSRTVRSETFLHGSYVTDCSIATINIQISKFEC